MKKKSERYLAKRAARRKAAAQQLPPDEPLAPRPRRPWIFRLMKLLFVTVLLGALSVASNLYQLVSGPIWPTGPSFTPGSPSFSSALDIPFVVANKSAFFRATNLVISCHLHLNAVSPTRSGILMRDGIFATIAPQGLNPVLEPQASAPYTCPVRNHLRLDNRDAIDSINGSQVYFTSEYDTRFFGRSRSQSEIFTLDTHTSPPQWVVGTPLK